MCIHYYLLQHFLVTELTAIFVVGCYSIFYPNIWNKSNFSLSTYIINIFPSHLTENCNEL